MNFNVSTGTIVANELFGDCWDYYPTVILTCGGNRNLHYAKSAANAISAYTSTTASISIDTAVLAARPRVRRSVHVGQKRDFINPQGVDDDMHMDIAAVVMPVRVGAD